MGFKSSFSHHAGNIFQYSFDSVPWLSVLGTKTKDNSSLLEIDFKVVKMPEVPYSVCLTAAHLSNSLRGYLSTLAPVWSLTGSCEKAPFMVSPSWLRSGWDLWGAGSSLPSSDCRTWLCHEQRSPVTPSELSLLCLPAALPVANDRHPPGDKLNDSWNPGPRGTCCLFIVTHKHKADREFITLQFQWLKRVFDYQKEAVNVCRDLHNSHFLFHLADGHSGYVSVAICSAAIASIFFAMLTYVCKRRRSCIVHQNISGLLVWSCHLILKEGWNYLNGAEPWCHKLRTA